MRERTSLSSGAPTKQHHSRSPGRLGTAMATPFSTVSGSLLRSRCPTHSMQGSPLSPVTRRATAWSSGRKRLLDSGTS